MLPSLMSPLPTPSCPRAVVRDTCNPGPCWPPGPLSNVRAQPPPPIMCSNDVTFRDATVSNDVTLFIRP